MELVTAEEMRTLDQKAINEYGIPGVVLMENAGLSVFKLVKEHFGGELGQKRVLILAGKGNNGGDGFVVARHLANVGCDVKLCILCKPEEFQGDALTNWQILRRMNIRYHVVLNERDLNVVRVALMYTELVIDAIFGTGFKGEAGGTVAKIIQLVNEAGKPVVSVDLPSGAEADTGCVRGACIKATYTVTFALPKLGLVLEPAVRYVGSLLVGDISLPAQLISREKITRFLLDAEWCRKTIPVRDPDSHKGNFGHVFIIGGSPGMTGAVSLAAWAAVRSGAGLVTVGIPSGLNSVIETKVTEAMSLPLPETEEGTISRRALDIIKRMAAQKVVVLGPGLSRQKETQELVKGFLPELPCPVVVDADALFSLSSCRNFKRKSSFPLILTPHPGEMAWLHGISTGDVQANRVEIVQKTSRDWNAVVVLKGARTLVATPEGKLYVNSTGNPGMATGGTGDVLAGMIGAFLAQGLSAEKAAALGAFIHGMAGDQAAELQGKMGLAAGDLIDYIPKVIREFEGQ